MPVTARLDEDDTPPAPAGQAPGIGVRAWLPLISAWVASRAVVLGLALSQLTRATLFSDLNLLWAWANGAPYGEDPDPTLGEYPGAARLLALSGQLAPTPRAFGWAWIAVALLVDLALLVVLRRQSRHAGWLWVVAGAALGPVMWLRYDLLVALLAVVAVVQRSRRPGLSGVLWGLAVLLKLWPVVVGAALLPRAGWPRWAGAAAGTVGAGLLVEALLAGPGSVATPVTYQSERGVQIESLPGGAGLLQRLADEPGEVWEFANRAFQLQGSSSGPVSLVAVVVLAAAAVAVLVATTRCPRVRLPAVRAVGAALLSVLVVATNAVFSPQYVMWFLPLVALVVGWAWGSPALASSWLGPVLAAVAVAVAGLTQVVWPWGYPALLDLEPWAVGLLVTRNGLVLVLAFLLGWALAAQPAQPGRNDSRT